MRRRPAALLSIAILAAVVLIGWSQPWFVVGAGEEVFEIRGESAAPALLPLALAILALAAVLAIAGHWLRLVAAVLVGILGAVVVVASIVSLSDPTGAIERAISERTGLTGDSALERVTSAGFTLWPIVAIAGGALLVALGIVIGFASRHWTHTERRYGRPAPRAGADVTPETPGSVADPDARVDPIGSWDALSDGDDPTVR